MIKIENLKFAYAGSNRYAINDLSLEIKQGDFIAVLGHNGSGKSTLSKVLVGLYKPAKGKVTIDGIEINKKNLREVRKRIGIVFQNPENQFIGSTVEDDIAFGLENKKITRSEMKELIIKNAKKVNMLDFLDHQPHNLSGGQKQRVAIASTLALDPNIIIFDEVTSMLDPKGKSEVLEIINSIKQKRNKTLISITHDMEEAILADNLVVLSNGKLVAFGPPYEILSNTEIVRLAKIDAPFIYKISKHFESKGVKPTYLKDELLEELCKLKQKN